MSARDYSFGARDDRSWRRLHPPAKADVVTVASERVGITNGLLLKFPQMRSVGDLTLLERPRVAIVGARKATVEGRRRAAQLVTARVRGLLWYRVSLHQAADSCPIGHPVFVAAGVLENPKLSWPKRFIGEDKPRSRPPHHVRRDRLRTFGDMRSIHGLALGTNVIDASHLDLDSAAVRTEPGRTPISPSGDSAASLVAPQCPGPGFAGCAGNKLLTVLLGRACGA